MHKRITYEALDATADLIEELSAIWPTFKYPDDATLESLTNVRVITSCKFCKESRSDLITKTTKPDIKRKFKHLLDCPAKRATFVIKELKKGY
jgi:hypothetical protein